MNFSNNPYDNFKNIKYNQESISGENLVVSKRVKSVRQLTRSEKEVTRLCYKNAILKGLVTINDIQYYICRNTKLWIDRSGLEYLKKSEEREDWQWFVHLARDQMSYIGVYRKSIDQLELIKSECWKMISDPDLESSIKVQCLREIHSVTKTMALLLRDLPFVTNITKYWDHETLASLLDQSQEINSRISMSVNQENYPQVENSKDGLKATEKSGLEIYLGKSGSKDLKNSDSKHPSIVNVDDSIMEEMSKQVNYSATDLDSKTYTDSVKKLKDIFEE